MIGDSQTVTIADVKQSLAAVQKWVEDRDYRGYEPFDGLSSWARPLMLGNQFAERLLMQAVRQSPLNLRPFVGIHPKDSTKGRGYMAWGYVILYQATQQKEYLDKATACLEWLDKHKAPKFQHHSWSNHFDFVSRGGGYTKDDPIIVWTALIGHAYLQAYEATRKEWFLDIANSACKWIMGLPREKTSQGTCLSYIMTHQSSIHNSNMLGAALLARTAKYNGNKEFLAVARSAMEYSCYRQLSDGSWWYGEATKYHWVDNFHTGYNLDSLKFYVESSGDAEFRPHLKKGIEYYKANFFEPDGCPKYYNSKKFPVDIQAAGQSIETLADFSDEHPDCLELAKKVAAWTINNMQDKRGFFYYRQYPLVKAKTPMLHWGQGTMFKGLAVLFRTMSRQNGPTTPVNAQTSSRPLAASVQG